MLSTNLNALRRGVEKSAANVRLPRRAGVSAFIACLVCSLFALALAPSASAQSATYIYSGTPFTNCAAECSPGATRITGSFTVSQPLPNNLFTNICFPPVVCRSLAQIFPLSFSFSDGNTTFTDKNVPFPSFQVVTDGQGRIIAWDIDLNAFVGGVFTVEIQSDCRLPGPPLCDAFPNFINEVDSSTPFRPSSLPIQLSFSQLGGTWRLGGFDLLDPVPSFGHPSLLNGQGIINDADLLAASTQIVNGVAADGVTQVVVRLDDVGGNAGDQIQFSLYNDQGIPALSNAPTEDGFLTTLDGTVTGNTITVPAIGTTASADPMAFAIYHAPIDFVRPNNQNDPAAPTRAVTIQLQVQSQNAGTGSVQIVRPPVALVHGLWSNRGTWDFFAPLALANGQYDSRFQAYRIDYAEHNGDHVDTIVSSPGGPIDQLISDLADFKVRLNVAAIQFDVVAHSMGGLVTRDMTLDDRFLAVSNFNKGVVHKLITIGTPHNGSPLVNELNQSSALCKAFFGSIGNTVAGAVEDLSVGSSFLAKVNGRVLPTPLKAHAIVGIANITQQATSELGLGTVTTFVCKNVLPNGYSVLYGGDASDLLVPETSQHFNFFPATTFETVSDTIHSVAPLVFPLGPDELNRVLGVTGSLLLNPLPASDPAIDPNRVINGLNTPISDGTYFADIKP